MHAIFLYKNMHTNKKKKSEGEEKYKLVEKFFYVLTLKLMSKIEKKTFPSSNFSNFNFTCIP